MASTVTGKQGNRRIGFRWAGVLMLLCCQWAMAADVQSLGRLLVASGVDGQMSVFEKMVQGSLAQNPAIEGEQREVLQHIAMESFRGDVIYRHVEAVVESALQPGDLETLLLWYDSPLGKRITELELQSLEPGSLPALQAAAADLAENKERISSAARLDALTQSAALGVTLQQRAMLANAMAESIAANPESPVDTRVLDAQLQQHQSAMQQLMQQQTLLSLAFTYRALPLEKIASYESFLSTSAAQRYQQGLQSGLLAGVEATLGDWEAGLREYY